jgi:non-specific serine/threonine protein kinase
MSDPTRIGKYEIRRSLGEGAMGTVYQGYDPFIGRLVAIKTIRRSVVDADLDGRFLERFRNEARAAGRLTHPNIVGVYEYGEDAANAFIAMEFVAGVDLSRYVAGRPGLGLDQSIALVSQLLNALDYAHQAGVVHRDVKPSNLIITAEGVLKVGDFGIARIDAAHLTATGVAMGTPAYMSPEQCRGLDVDGRSDLFSTGVVLYELLTGSKPFEGAAEAMAYKICHEQPEPPSRRSPLALPPVFDGVLVNALAKEPAARYPSANAFRTALHDAARAAGVHVAAHDATRIPMATQGVSLPIAAPSGNLPQQVNAFVGRERELADVTRLLRESRLVTLVGTGGLGKTRLSIEASLRVGSAYPDGAWLVELAPLDDGRLVAQAVASALGVKDDPDRPLRETLVKHVHDRRLLLLLDNCEHLTRACAELCHDLLRAGAGITILTTSREPLHVGGEMTYAVAPLAVPDPRLPLSVDALAQIAAVRLFVDRAAAAQSSFALSERNAHAVADICQRLDGIPLALELAAARARSLPVEIIAARLSDRFRLLKGGDQTALPRQQTLRAMLDWSHDLLGEPQRAVFRRLAVFAGDFSLEGAESVAAGGSVAADDVLDLTAELVEKSLVSLDPEQQRYRLLQTVRHYAQEKLEEAGEAAEASERHRHYYVALAETADPRLMGAEQEIWHARLDAERENLLAAHAECGVAAGAAQEGLRLVHALRTWLRRGSTELAQRMGIEALARAGADERTLARCQALFTTGGFCYFAGRYDEARTYAEESLAIAREHGDLPKTGDALAMMGLAALGRGDTVESRRNLEEAVAIGRQICEPMRLHQALNCLAEAESTAGDREAARTHYEEAMTLAREIGAADTIAVTQFNLARVRIDSGMADEAASLLCEALPYLGGGAGDSEVQQFVTVAAGLAAHQGQWERAARLSGLSEALYARGGARREPADEAFLAPLITLARASLGAAAFASAEAEGGSLQLAEVLAEIESWLRIPGG